MGRKSLDERIREYDQQRAKALEAKRARKMVRVQKRQPKTLGVPKPRKQKSSNRHSVGARDERLLKMWEAYHSSPAPRGQHIVYFFRQGSDGPIKIGRTVGNPLQRLVMCQTGNPYRLSIIAIITGTAVDAELDLHARFRHLRLEGEWFMPASDLLDYIRYNASPWDEVAHLWPKMSRANRESLSRGLEADSDELTA
jgi:hypothetical protein